MTDTFYRLRFWQALVAFAGGKHDTIPIPSTQEENDNRQGRKELFLLFRQTSVVFRV